MYDLVIKNGRLPDFEKDQLAVKDIAIKQGLIVDIGESIGSGKEIIDARGLIVSPGFIDIHMHEEVIGHSKDGDDYDIANKMLAMGVTTAVGGNCGNNRQNTKDFMDFVENKGAPINYLTYIGHNFLRNQLGIDPYEPATKSQIEKMKEQVKIAIDQEGSIGISFGIEYSPGITYDELVEIGGAYEGQALLSAHYRRDADGAIESIKEMINISKDTKKPMQIAHIGSCSAFGHMKASLELIQKARNEGLSIAGDCYPYDAFSTRIGSAVFDDGCFQTWNKSYDSILLTEEPYKGKYCDEQLFKKARKEYPQMLAVAFVMNELEVIEALQAPFIYVASDALMNKGQGHPRGAGTFPRVLGKYVREQGNLTLLDALKKMTYLPAQRLGLNQKGQVKEGMDADLVIFDENRIIDRATFTEPAQAPRGIEYVIVKGNIGMKKGQMIHSRLGTLIKRQTLKG